MTALAPPIVEFDRVTFGYGGGSPWRRSPTIVLHDVTLSLHQGETLGIVGESGSGKSTLARLSLGLHQPNAGRVLFDGSPMGRGSQRRLRGQRQVVLQNPQWSLNPRLRCGQSIAEPLAIERVGDRASRRGRVHELLELVGLPATVAERYPHELSGGQQQRVAIARALATSPRLLVLDEVVSALDVSVQAQILNLLRDLQQDQGFAAVFISHDLEVVRYLAHRVAVLYGGRVVEITPAEALYERAAHPYTRALQLAQEAVPDPRFELGDDGPVAGDACVLAARCPFAEDRCWNGRPELRPFGSSTVACHRAEEVAEVE
jgi:ABC-type glutathione transport system ATPase component